MLEKLLKLLVIAMAVAITSRASSARCAQPRVDARASASRDLSPPGSRRLAGRYNHKVDSKSIYMAINYGYNYWSWT
jgi:RES domain-containing protein